MPAFSKMSQFRLDTCHPDLVTLFEEVVKYLDCTILVGYRSEIDQQLAFTSGKSKLQYPNSAHNKTPSMAADVTPYPLNFAYDLRINHFAGYVMGMAQKLKDEGKMTHSVRWGGDWSGDPMFPKQALSDRDHFELIP